jgi:polynucleotide 5'-kinase involved in rRNA processing
MARTLLLSSASFTWRDWLKEHRKDRDLLCIDPSEPSQSPPGKLTMFRGAKPFYSRFYGSLDPSRSPHVIVAALAHMLPLASGDAIVQLFAVRNAPLVRQMAGLCAQMVQPDEILAPRGAELDLEGFPVGPEEVDLEATFPAMVQQAQRKAQWLKLIEECSEHTLILRQVSVEGTRLGSGEPIHPDMIAKAGLREVVHAEVASGTLLLVTETEPEDHVIARALDIFHASRASVVGPDAYNNLLCSFARQNGEDFGMGIVKRIDFESGVATIASTAVPPAPVRILRLGGLRVDLSGRELGEVRPWQV